ncbi:hypothetical protein, partial [Chlamydia trachomatis]
GSASSTDNIEDADVEIVDKPE